MEQHVEKTAWDRVFVWSAQFLGWGAVAGTLSYIILGRGMTREEVGSFFPVLIALSVIYMLCFFYMLLYLARTEGKKSLKDKDVQSFRLVRRKR